MDPPIHTKNRIVQADISSYLFNLLIHWFINLLIYYFITLFIYEFFNLLIF